MRIQSYKYEGRDHPSHDEAGNNKEDIAETAQLCMLEIKLFVAVSHNASHAGPLAPQGLSFQVRNRNTPWVIPVQGGVRTRNDHRNFSSQFFAAIKIDDLSSGSVHVTVGGLYKSSTPPVGYVSRDGIISECGCASLVRKPPYTFSYDFLMFGQHAARSSSSYAHLQLIGFDRNVLNPDSCSWRSPEPVGSSTVIP
ncbi:hypothetical protein ASG92_25360 [Arthrobacter sp. Soil736]|nr:hypothetical protein ASG92_25360 [Arthrobacter sp. Soil736]